MDAAKKDIVISGKKTKDEREKVLKSPPKPSAADVQRHNAKKHLPTADWCDICISAKGKSDHHCDSSQKHFSFES